MKIVKEIQDLTYLRWTRTRHSSGTAGSFLKAYEVRKGRKFYYKLSNYDAVNQITGHECVNEIIVDRLLTRMGIPHLSYRLIHARIMVRDVEMETYLCCSEDFKSSGDSKIALDAYYDMEAYPGECPMDFCSRMGFEQYIYQMLIVDYLILNRDRHGANIEILKNKKTREIKPAPLFDHGLSLLFSCTCEEDYRKTVPTEDRPIQCFVGGHSSYENLRLIPWEYRILLPAFDEELKGYLFQDMEDIMGEIWVDSVWDFLKTRADVYSSMDDDR